MRALPFGLPLLSLLPFSAHLAQNDMSNYYLADDFNRSLLRSLAPDAVYYSSGDYTSFPALYLQAVEGERLDITLADFTGRPSKQLVQYARTLTPSVDPLDADALFDVVLDGPRPVYVAAKSSLRGRAPRRVVPVGLAYRVVSGARDAPPTGASFDETALRNLVSPTALDDLGRNILFDYHLMRGESLFEAGQVAAGREALLEAARYAGESPEAHNNLGSTCAERGLDNLPEQFFRKAIALNPSYHKAHRNLAALLADGARNRKSRGDVSDAARRRRIAEFRLAATREPQNPAVWNNLGSALAEGGAPTPAEAAFQRRLNSSLGTRCRTRTWRDSTDPISATSSAHSSTSKDTGN